MKTQENKARPRSEKQFLRPKDFLHIYGQSSSTIRRWKTKGLLPPPVVISPRVYGWHKTTLDTFFGMEVEA